MRARRSKAPPWTSEEIAILCDVYPREGVNGCADALPERSWGAIQNMAHKLGVRSPYVLIPTPKAKLDGDDLEEAIRLREDGWSFERIGERFGVSETAAQNAVVIALCPRLGYTPAQRDENGHLLPERLAEPRTLAELDVSAIRAALAPLAESGEPETQNSGLSGKGDVVAATLREKNEQIASLEDQVDQLKRLGDVLYQRGVIVGIGMARNCLSKLIDVENEHPSSPGVDAETVRDVQWRIYGQGGEAAGGQSKGSSPSSTSRPEQADPDAAPNAPTDTTIRGRKALAALAEIYPAALTESQWATIAGYAKTGGTWSTYKGELRRAGLIEQDSAGLWKATRDGCAAAGVAPKKLPPIGPDRARYWSARVPGVHRMVEVLVKRWPHFTTREGLAADLGMAAGGGTFGTYLGRLRTNALLEEQGKRLRLAPDVMGKP